MDTNQDVEQTIVGGAMAPIHTQRSHGLSKVEPPRPEGRGFLDYAQRYSAHVSVYKRMSQADRTT